MPRVLFLGCNHNQLPYLRAAKAQGFKVIGTDVNPKAPGAALADRFYTVGYDDVDGLVCVAQAEGLDPGDRVFTAAAHFAWEGAAGVAFRLNLPYPSPETVDICLDKAKLYPLLQRLGVSVPPSSVVESGEVPELDPSKFYYLKSDYGKSPRYCYRFNGGMQPALPRTFDRYYRRCFLLQEEVSGVHYRVNLYGDQAAVFLKLTDRCALPLPVLGPGHNEVVTALQRVTEQLGLTQLVTKYDLIIDESGWHVIDLGLDPPMRLRLLLEHRGIDMPAAYVRMYLSGDGSGFRNWTSLAVPAVIIEGTLQEGARFIQPRAS